MKKRTKMLLALQMWEGDAKETCELAQLLIDLQAGEINPHADLLLVYRRDCKPRTKLEVAARSAFAQVHVHVTRSRDTGFPAGPNGVWCDLMQHCDFMHRVNKWDYACVLTTEGDACPLMKDWADPLLTAWEDAEKMVVGCHMGSSHQQQTIGHINGNAMFHPRISTAIPRLYGCTHRAAWDMFFAKDFHRVGWQDTPLIRNEYQAQTMTAKEIAAHAKRGTVWLHGVKDSSVRDWARRMLVK